MNYKIFANLFCAKIIGDPVIIFGLLSKEIEIENLRDGAEIKLRANAGNNNDVEFPIILSENTKNGNLIHVLAASAIIRYFLMHARIRIHTHAHVCHFKLQICKIDILTLKNNLIIYLCI